MKTVGAPDFLGYLACYVVASIAVTVPFALVAVLDPTGGGPVERVSGALFVMMLGTEMAGVYGLPAGAAGCCLLHVALRRVPSQAVHVAAFAVVGALAGWAYDAWLFDFDTAWFPLALACATAVGRLAVIPLVRTSP